MSVDVASAEECGTPASVPASCSAVPPIEVSQAVASVTATNPLSSSSLLDQIEELRQTQQKLKVEKAKLAKDMKHAMKRKKRLRSRASQLTDVDLVDVLRMRQIAVASSANKLESKDTVEPAESIERAGAAEAVKDVTNIRGVFSFRAWQLSFRMGLRSALRKARTCLFTIWQLSFARFSTIIYVRVVCADIFGARLSS